MSRKIGKCFFLLFLLFSFFLFGKLFAQPAEEGRTLFNQKCSGCHTIGKGDLVGPDLKEVSKRRERGWITHFILVPDKVIKQKDPSIIKLVEKYKVEMPNLNLTGLEVEKIVTFLEKGTVNTEPEPTARKLPRGDALLGKGIFTGSIRMQNGGPACLACHSISGIETLGGGTLGPDLTKAYSKLGDALITWPQNIPPMKSIYSDHSITEEEQHNLLAFFEQSAVTERPIEAVGQLTLVAGTGLAVLLVLAHLIWRHRISEVRRAMIKRT